MEDNDLQTVVEENPDNSKEERLESVIPEPEPEPEPEPVQLSYRSVSKLARILIDIARTSSQKKTNLDADSNDDN